MRLLLHYSHKPQVWEYSGPEAVFLSCVRCLFCLRAGDLSCLNHQGTFYFPPTAQLILMGREYHRVFFVCSSSSPTYLALLQHSFTPTRSLCRAKAGVRRRLQPQTLTRQTKGRLTFGRIEKPHFKAVTHFKLMFQITVRGSSNGMSFKLATAVFAYCSSNLWHTRTYMHIIAQTVRPLHPAHWQIFPLWEPQVTQCLATIFISGKKSEQEENYFPISYEFCQNRVSGVSGQRLIALQN